MPNYVQPLPAAPNRKTAAAPVDMNRGTRPRYEPMAPVLDNYVAPQTLPVRPAAGADAASQLSRALAGMQPGLNKYLEKSHELQGDNVQAAAVEAAQAWKDMDLSFEQLLKQNPDLPYSADPRYRMAYDQERMRYSAQAWGMGLTDQAEKDGTLLDPNTPDAKVVEWLDQQKAAFVAKFQDADPLSRAKALTPIVEGYRNKTLSELSGKRLKRLEAARYETASQTVSQWLDADMAAGKSAAAIATRVSAFMQQGVQTGLSGTKLNDLIWEAYAAQESRMEMSGLAESLAKATKTRPGDPKSPSLYDVARIRRRADALTEHTRDSKLRHESLVNTVENQRRTENLRLISNEITARLVADPLDPMTDVMKKAESQGVLTDAKRLQLSLQNGIIASREVRVDSVDSVQMISTALSAKNFDLARRLTNSFVQEGKLKTSTYMSMMENIDKSESYMRELGGTHAYRNAVSDMDDYIKFAYSAPDPQSLDVMGSPRKMLTAQGHQVLNLAHRKFDSKFQAWAGRFQDENGRMPKDYEKTEKAWEIYDEVVKSLPKPEKQEAPQVSVRGDSEGKPQAATPAQPKPAAQPKPEFPDVDLNFSDLVKGFVTNPNELVYEKKFSGGDGKTLTARFADLVNVDVNPEAQRVGEDDVATAIRVQLGLQKPSEAIKLADNLLGLLRERYGFQYDKNNPRHKAFLQALIKAAGPQWAEEMQGGAQE